MTPEQALQILDQAASMAVLNRADHQKVTEALGVLQEAIGGQQEALESQDG